MQISASRCLIVVGGLTVLGLAMGFAPTEAAAFCRTMTKSVPADFPPRPGTCWNEGVPLWWKSACVGYSVQRNASRQISYDDSAQIISKAFTRWTGANCPVASPTGPSRVSIDVRDLGPVACDQVQYNTDAPNQHVIVFRDDVWPHSDPNNTLALTTIQFNPETGEIYDADMEVNTTQKMTVTDPVPADGFDFASVVTHEAGHFLGLAHSGDAHATMYARYVPGSTAMRNLTIDDVQGICSVYAPDGTRNVAASVVESTKLASDPCDPVPRHGFGNDCKQTPKKTCSASIATGAPSGGLEAAGLSGLAVLTASIVRRLRRKTATMAG